MAYTVNRFIDTTKLLTDDGKITIADDDLNTSDSSLSLVGKYYVGYGETIAQNSINLLENFASDTQPVYPIEGQLWWEPTAKILNVRHAQAWIGIDADSIVTLRSMGEAVGAGTHKVVIARAAGTIVSITSDHSFTLDPCTGESPAPLEVEIHAAFLDGGAGTETTINAGINLNTVTASAMKFHGTATYAQYADVAELYTSDEEYEPGTVLILNLTSDSHEVTQSIHELDPGQIGVVTSDPALLMNSALEGTTVGVALLGRVPVKVTGKVKKGDRMVTGTEPGHAQSNATLDAMDYNYKHVIGRAIEDKHTQGPGIIEVIVGVK